MAVVPLTLNTVDAIPAAGHNIEDLDTVMASANTYTVANDGLIGLIVYGGVAGGNLTIQTPRTVDCHAVAESVIALTAAKTYPIGFFNTKTYNDGSGLLTISSSVEDMRVYAFKMTV